MASTSTSLTVCVSLRVGGSAIAGRAVVVSLPRVCGLGKGSDGPVLLLLREPCGLGLGSDAAPGSLWAIGRPMIAGRLCQKSRLQAVLTADAWRVWTAAAPAEAL